MFAEDRALETGFSFSERVPAPPERRRAERLVTILRVGTLIVGRRRELCLVRNISAGGLMAHVYSPLRPGQRVEVELRSNQPIGGRVVWLRAANAGIAFDAPVDIAELLANPPQLANGWRPRAPRIEVDRVATVRAGARTHWVRARDVSQGGVRVDTGHALAPGEEVVVTLEDFRAVAGTVRWRKGRDCGIGFREPLPFAELVAWLKRVR